MAEDNNPMDFFGKDHDKQFAHEDTGPERPEGPGDAAASLKDTLIKTYHFLPHEEKLEALKMAAEGLSTDHERFKDRSDYQELETEKRDNYETFLSEYNEKYSEYLDAKEPNEPGYDPDHEKVSKDLNEGIER